MPRLLSRLEPYVVIGLVWLCFMAVPWSQNGIGLGWDSLNHHIYLGWTAEAERFTKDWRAAGSQVYQLPYLYWPVYYLAAHDFSGRDAGLVLASLNATTAWPLWWIARSLIPGDAWLAGAARLMAVLMAYASGVVLSQLDTTLNDLLAAQPLLLSIALTLQGSHRLMISRFNQYDQAWLPGLLAGVSVAFKLSNGPLVLALPLLWMMAASGGLLARLLVALSGGLCLLLGFTLIYMPWGLILQNYFGSFFYPFF